MNPVAFDPAVSTAPRGGAIAHHPGDELLLAFAAGKLRPAQALVMAVHVETCARCRSRCRQLEALGGVLLDAIEPMPLDANAWTRTLERIDAMADAVPSQPPAALTATDPAAAAESMPWPHALARCEPWQWRWMGPGMRFARLHLRDDPGASLYLLRIAEGRSLPRHTHRGSEWTQVLCGSFDDGRAHFAAGDFDEADSHVHHQPVVRPGRACICLAWLDAPLRFDGRVAALIGGLVGL